MFDLHFFEISVPGTKTDKEYFDKQKPQFTESIQTRILHSFGLDALHWKNYVLKRKIELTLKKTIRDSTITFKLNDPKLAVLNLKVSS